MRTKTIKKILDSKISKWIETIDDKDAKAAAKRSVIITGGSIASMLLNEEVNDFDIYFKNKKDLKLICEYYTKDKDLAVLDCEDTYFQEELICKLKWGIGNAYGSIEEGQIKLRLNWEAGFLKMEYDKIKDNSFVPLYFTQNAITLSDKIQIVIRFNWDVDEIHENYDFVHATNSYDYQKNKLNLRPEAMECLLTRELKYIGSKYPLTSIIRTKKFINRKWKITAGEYLKIMWQVNELDLTDLDVLSEQLVGVDSAYFNELIGVLRKQDKKKITYPYICEVIDRIFS